jgi:hypothetical protein
MVFSWYAGRSIDAVSLRNDMGYQWMVIQILTKEKKKKTGRK